MKTPIAYYGGKQTLCKHIIPMIPKHKIYIEPFFGGGAVFFAKKPSAVEIINDLNGEVINFFEVLKNKFEELDEEIKFTIHSKDLYKKSYEIYKRPNEYTEVERAWAFWFQTQGTMLNSPGNGLSYGINFKDNCNQMRTHYNKREKFRKEYSGRLKNTYIENKEALEVLKNRNYIDGFYFIDIPYPGADQGHYENMFSSEDLKELLEVLVGCKGKFILTTYITDEVQEFVEKNGWKTKIVKRLIASSLKSKNKRVQEEYLIYNYSLEEINQKALF